MFVMFFLFPILRAYSAVYISREPRLLLRPLLERSTLPRLLVALLFDLEAGRLTSTFVTSPLSLLTLTDPLGKTPSSLTSCHDHSPFGGLSTGDLGDVVVFTFLLLIGNLLEGRVEAL